MVSPLPQRTLADWTPDAGPEDAWLARCADQGWWRPEYGYGVWVQVGGYDTKRYAMIKHGDGLAVRKPAGRRSSSGRAP